MSQANLESEKLCIPEELRPVSLQIYQRAGSILQTQLIGAYEKCFDNEAKGPFKGTFYIIVCPDSPIYDEYELNRISSVVKDTVLDCAINRKYAVIPHPASQTSLSLYLPWIAIDEKVKPWQTLPGFAATKKGEPDDPKNRYRTLIKIIPDRELAELVLLRNKFDFERLSQIIEGADIREYGEAASSYNTLAKRACLGLDQLSIAIPNSLVGVINPGDQSIAGLPQEEQAEFRKISYIKTAIAMEVL
ncbi:MAG: hypothetical protein Q7K55_07715 [Candidatus Levybacteria bacterium]|nr:hypothetical protein [Candidatus Levybacteria bacterium]